MSLIETSRTDRDPTRETEIIESYRQALERAVALAPALRAERTALAATAPPEGARPSAVRRRAYLLVIVAAAGAPLFAPAASILVCSFGAAVGLAAAAAGDRLGAALRRLVAPAPLRPRAARFCGAIIPTAEVALVVVALTLVSGSRLAGLLLGATALALALVSYATRKRDVEIEARAAAHASASRRLEATEQAVRAAMAGLRIAHAADLARLTSEMGSPSPLVHAARPLPSFVSQFSGAPGRATPKAKNGAGKENTRA